MLKIKNLTKVYGDKKAVFHWQFYSYSYLQYAFPQTDNMQDSL